MDVNWFPGHMAKTLREMRDHVKLVDIVIETCDARIPESSRNPELDRLLGQKPRILVLNKADLADPRATAAWLDWYRQKNIKALASESLRRGGLDVLRRTVLEMNQHKIDRALAKGRLIRPIRVLVVGIPNTGKSTMINALCGRKVAATADRPGVTRLVSWIRSGTDLELMDTPGVLWPRLGEVRNQLNLAATGAIKDELLPVEEVAARTLAALGQSYPDLVASRYKLDDLTAAPDVLLESATRKRGCLLPGNRPDLTRFANLFLDELRGGRIGRLTLEWPGQKQRLAEDQPAAEQQPAAAGKSSGEA